MSDAKRRTTRIRVLAVLLVASSALADEPSAFQRGLTFNLGPEDTKWKLRDYAETNRISSAAWAPPLCPVAEGKLPSCSDTPFPPGYVEPKPVLGKDGRAHLPPPVCDEKFSGRYYQPGCPTPLERMREYVHLHAKDADVIDKATVVLLGDNTAAWLARCPLEVKFPGQTCTWLRNLPADVQQEKLGAPPVDRMQVVGPGPAKKVGK